MDRAQRVRAGRDGGFSLVEVLVAISLIGVLMTALGSFYVSSLVTTSIQSGRQVATQIATDALERARSLPVGTLEAGLANTTKRVDNVPYTQAWAVAECRFSGSTCVAPGASEEGEYLRVTVTVTWADQTCPTAGCTYAASTLISRSAIDPLFNTQHGSPPSIDAIADRTSVEDVAITSLQATRSGGLAPWTWTVTGLPTGLSMNASGLISGTPTTPGTYNVVITLRDGYARSDVEDFRWTITTPPPDLTSPGNQTTTAGVAVNRTITRTSGTSPFAFTATGLPPGLAINATNGTITGTPTTVGTSNVTVTVTDAAGLTDSVSFTWTRPALTLGTPVNQDSDNDFNITPVQLAVSGGVVPYTWTSQGLPAGLTISASGLISGRPTGEGNHPSIRITVTDASGTSASTNLFTWMVRQ
jgi:prepilin-type N-terminal cleavage/methylation domain-containing protein